MKIENINEYKELEYPKLDKIDSNKLKKCIPKKWFKLGFTSLIISILFKTESLASSYDNEAFTMSLSGRTTYPTYQVAEDIGLTTKTFLLLIISNVTFIAFLILLLKVLICKVKSIRKKQKYHPKKITIILIIIFFLLTLLIKLILYYSFNFPRLF